MKQFLYLPLLCLFVACGAEVETQDEPVIEISTTDIDTYVSEKSDASQEYDVSLSLRFAKEDDTYEVVQYQQNDTLILFIESEMTADMSVSRKIFFKNSIPVFIDEYLAINTTETEPFVQRKIYLDGGNVLNAVERKSFSEGELETLDYKETTADMSNYDFDRPDQAMRQQGDFALQFEEFIIIDPQTYLVLGNDESGYDAALFVADEHELLTEINQNQEAYKGKTMHVYHQFVLTNGIERMLFIDGEMEE